MTRTQFTILPLGILILTAIGCTDSSSDGTEATSYKPRVQRVEVEVANVAKQSISSQQEFTGNLLPRRMTRIVAEVEGVVQDIPRVGAKFDVMINGERYVEQLGITYGQVVKAGDVLVQLDPRDYEIELRMSQAKLAKAKADLVKLQSWDRPEEVRRLAALRDEAAARLEQKHRDLARSKSLLPSRAVTEAEYEQAAMELSTAKAIVDSAEASLAAAEAGPTAEEVVVQQALVAQAEAEVDQKQQDVVKTTIRAPYDGVVTAINVEVGERVSTSGDPLVEIMDLRYVVAEISIPESYVGSVQIGDEATVKAAGVIDPVPGLVVAINERVDPSTRTFRVRVAIDNARTRFKAGQFATVQLPMKATVGDSLVVPSRSLVLIEGEPHVFIVREDRVQQRAVRPGIASEGMIEILNGLQDGESVVVDDPSLLADGMAVTVKQASPKVALH